MEQNVLIEVIKALSIVTASAIPSLVSYWLGVRLIQRKRLETNLKQAITDLEFLLTVEQFHTREHLETSGKSNRNLIRQAVSLETNLTWSGKFTLSRIKKKLTQLN
ncbi:hypothetical protein H5185_15475 [Shewanella sp. SG44-6]|jgi:hypothetical protein|uniref:hypothetical protein n=1 Tax=Shewanella sp. SG44-6 TaxID=2760959 RepID=UPI0016035C1B|nr:hypothetical protein [Shewanella sp. SG44-6]MBB1390805.1 hypothetical protein [Shewanella sp. SG44-6]